MFCCQGGNISNTLNYKKFNKDWRNIQTTFRTLFIRCRHTLQFYNCAKFCNWVIISIFDVAECVRIQRRQLFLILEGASKVAARAHCWHSDKWTHTHTHPHTPHIFHIFKLQPNVWQLYMREHFTSANIKFSRSVRLYSEQTRFCYHGKCRLIADRVVWICLYLYFVSILCIYVIPTNISASIKLYTEASYRSVAAAVKRRYVFV